MLLASRRDGVLDDIHIRVEPVNRLLGGVHLGGADALGGVDHLALQVRQVHVVVVDDPERPHAGRGKIEGGRRAEPTGAEQEHLRVEQLLLAIGPDLGDQQVARVALALLGGERARDIDLVAAVLPQRDAAGHGLDMLVAEVLFESAGGIGRAVARGAVEDDVRLTV